MNDIIMIKENVYLIKSEKTDDFYKVRLEPNNIKCSCRGFSQHNKCKHILKALKYKFKEYIPEKEMKS